MLKASLWQHAFLFYGLFCGQKPMEAWTSQAVSTCPLEAEISQLCNEVLFACSLL